MQQPGLLGAAVGNDGDMMRMIQDLQRQVQQLAAANPLATMGITPLPGATQFDGGVTSNGQLTANGLTVNGAAVIAGTLSLPAGIINNDALANPLSPLAFHADANNFALSNGPNVPIVTQTITVPAGYTKAVVNATASLSAANSTGATDTLYCGILVAGSGPGYSGRVGVQPGVAANPSRAAGVLLTSLGSSFTIQATASTFVANWAADVNNNANLDGTVIFLR